VNPFKIINKYYNPQSTEYQVLIIHSTLVAKKSLEIADLFSQRTKENISKSFIYEAALLHDLGFNFPGELKNREKFVGCYITHGYYGAEILRKEKLPKHAQVAENHVGLGLSREEIINNKWPLPLKDYYPETIAEKIIAYADLFYSKGVKKTEDLFRERSHEEVMKKIKSYQNFKDKIKIFLEWEKLLLG
jgi:uncharacterized protein